MEDKWVDAANHLTEHAKQGRLRLAYGEDELCLDDIFPSDLVIAFLSTHCDVAIELPSLADKLWHPLLELEEQLRRQLRRRSRNSSIPNETTTARLLWYNWFFVISFIPFVEPQRRWGEGSGSRPARAARVANSTTDCARCLYGIRGFCLYQGWTVQTLLSKPAEHHAKSSSIAQRALQFFDECHLSAAKLDGPVFCPVFLIAQATKAPSVIGSVLLHVERLLILWARFDLVCERIGLESLAELARGMEEPRILDECTGNYMAVPTPVMERILAGALRAVPLGEYHTDPLYMAG
ncbi:hypothetical protein HRG_000743 [Hirsutella rhossiliensis]|uniref:Uncharacterized protein n=1 Tax=Hirsutella rhossiliensis TaxID=111463 RepID=A0A9P8SMK4_9HYPO|nr:uncharacterized protein HRG_00743 [Hirsutella rhossiliensis]KAH0968101.1 hypothetical protein HRG_00743 [Hirsutella rhossiliensis]